MEGGATPDIRGEGGRARRYFAELHKSQPREKTALMNRRKGEKR